MLVLGTQLYETGYPSEPGRFFASSPWTYLAIAGLTPCLAALCFGLFKLFDHIAAKASSRLTILSQDNWKCFAITWVIIFVLWIPVLLLVFPGIFGYDSSNQISQYLGTRVRSSHHPIAHTLLLSSLVGLGDGAFGSLEAGLCTYSLFQMLVMSAIFAYTCKTIAYIKPLSRCASTLVVLYFGLFPVNSLLAVAATKDVLFAGFALLYCCFLLRLVEASSKGLPADGRLIAGAIISLVLAIAFRNNAVFAFCLTIPFIIVIFRKSMRRVLPLVTVALALGLAVNPTLIALTSSKVGSSNEMMSIPAQQLARVAVLHGDELSREEMNVLSRTVPNWQNYIPRISDQTKKSLDITRIDGTPVPFVKLYVDLGMKYPSEYLYQFLDITLASWYPFMKFRDLGAWHPYILFDASYGYGLEEPPDFRGKRWIYTQSFFPELHDAVAEYVYKCKWQEIPIVSLLFQPGFMFWVLLLALGYLISERRCKLLVPLLFPFAIWFTFLFGPLVQVRYLYILFLILPLELAMVTMPPPRHSSPE